MTSRSAALSPAGESDWGWRWRDLLLGGLLFFWIYSLAPTFFPIQSKRVITLVGLLVLAVLGIVFRRRLPMDRAVLQVVCIFLVTGSWVVMGSIRTGFETPTYLAAMVLTFGESFLGGLVVAAVLVRRTLDLDRVIRLFHLVILSQAILIIISFLSPEFRQITAEYIPARGNIHALDPIRVRGLSHSSGAHMAALQAMAILMVAYLVPRTRSFRHQLFLLGSTIPLILSIFFTGRTGFVMLPFAVLMWSSVMFFRTRFRLAHLAAYLGLLLLGVGAVGGTLWWNSRPEANSASSDQATALSFAYAAAERRLMTEFSGGPGQTFLGSRTLHTLFREMWIIPRTDEAFLFGDPRKYLTVQSDLGVIRHLHSGGLIGMILVYTSVLATFLVISFRLRDRGTRIFIWIFFLWLALLEFKEPMMINHLFAGMYFVIFWFTFLVDRRRGDPRGVLPAAPPVNAAPPATSSLPVTAVVPATP
ncbi:MAG: hypothetical protein WEA09_04085 [Gemmatimonadota bacterium]